MGIFSLTDTSSSYVARIGFIGKGINLKLMGI